MSFRQNTSIHSDNKTKVSLKTVLANCSPIILKCSRSLSHLVKIHCAFWKDRIRLSELKNVNPKYITKIIYGKKLFLKMLKMVVKKKSYVLELFLMKISLTLKILLIYFQFFYFKNLLHSLISPQKINFIFFFFCHLTLAWNL